MLAHRLFFIISFLSISMSANLFAASSSKSLQTVSFTKKEISLTISFDQACKIIGILERLSVEAPDKFQQLCQLCQNNGPSQLTPSDTMHLADYKLTSLIYTNLENNAKHLIIDTAGRLSHISKTLFLVLITHKETIKTAIESLVFDISI
ncbi:hypothetical protein K2X40_03565 [Candidatus Babeliales bacterium]|nr:hypothetical protein [Candidatus Babeliales bacterium]